MKRYMRHNRRSAAPSSLIAFDTETVPRPNPRDPLTEENVLRLGCAVRWRMDGKRPTRREEFTFTKGRQFLAWLAQVVDRQRRNWVFAHNLGFDLTAVGFWAQLESGAWRPSWRRRSPPSNCREPDDDVDLTGCIVTEDPPTILDLETCEGVRVTFVDLMNYFPMPLAQVGDYLGHPKMPFPGDEATDDYWAEYCRRDVEIVERAVTKLVNWVRDADLGNMRYTMGSQSLALYRHRCLDEQILLGHDDAVKVMERAAYVGMRARAYFVGTSLPRPRSFLEVEDARADGPLVERTGPVVRLDVNSCYPYAMAEENYPVEFLHSTGPVTPENLLAKLAAVEGCAEVIVDTLRRPYPLRQDGRTVWALGRFLTTLCGDELRTALDQGDVAQVVAAQLYRRGRPFRSFVAAVWQLTDRYREEKDWLLLHAAKTLGVSLHGKLAQRSIEWMTIQGECPPVQWGTYVKTHAQTGEVQSWRSLGGVAQHRMKTAETPDNFPLMAAYVTQYARRHLDRLKRCAGPRGVYYEDADSLHVSAEGYANLEAAGWIDPHRPGALKVVSTHDEGEWRGPKHYRLGGHWTAPLITPRTEIDETGACRQKRFHGLKSALSGPPPAGPLTEWVTYQYPVAHQAGRPGPDGWVDWPVVTDAVE